MACRRARCALAAAGACAQSAPCAAKQRRLCSMHGVGCATPPASSALPPPRPSCRCVIAPCSFKSSSTGVAYAALLGTTEPWRWSCCWRWVPAARVLAWGQREARACACHGLLHLQPRRGPSHTPLAERCCVATQQLRSIHPHAAVGLVSLAVLAACRSQTSTQQARQHSRRLLRRCTC